MKKTIFRQFLLYMILFAVILSVTSWLVIEFFFDNYYYLQQEKLLATHIEEIADEYEETGIQGIQPLIDEYYLDHGMSVHYLDVASNVIYGTESQGAGKQGLQATIIKSTIGKVFISYTGSANNPKEWLTYVINTDDSNFVMGRISYTSMDSVVGLVQQFFLYFGLALIIIFLIFAYVFSKSMSKPLKALNKIAEKMGHLDFSLKYEGNRKDEIGRLGITLNEITDKLENTISQLQGELSKERTLDKMRNQFTAQVSHELQTPLSVIKGYSEALADRIYSSEETAGVYDILLTEAGKISNMVDDLLDLSQMDSGAYIVRKEDFNIVQLVTKLFNRHKNLPSEKQYDMQLTINCSDNFMYSGDAVRLEQAFRNVLANAIKHVSKEGIVRLDLTENAGAVAVSIYNSGEAIPSEELTRIFDSYYQGSKNMGGTGLGLAITSHIIELHSGSIKAENREDGVLFSIFLP